MRVRERERERCCLSCLTMWSDTFYVNITHNRLDTQLRQHFYFYPTFSTWDGLRTITREVWRANRVVTESKRTCLSCIYCRPPWRTVWLCLCWHCHPVRVLHLHPAPAPPSRLSWTAAPTAWVWGPWSWCKTIKSSLLQLCRAFESQLASQLS